MAAADRVDERNRALGIVPPGDEIVPVPPPVNEEPPVDRFCDLVLTGGVASGVVYPWAIVELARAYRFKNIGGTSVGAMAAAIAAAAEYGRRTSAREPFETLRRVPAALGDRMPDGRTRMASLFQATPKGRRLMDLWVRLGRGKQYPDGAASGGEGSPFPGDAPGRTVLRCLREVFDVYRRPAFTGAAVGLTLGALGCLCVQPSLFVDIRAALVLFVTAFASVTAVAAAIWSDIRWGLIENELGLCKGGTLTPDEAKEPGLSEWLHNGIQRSAGLKTADSPLTFRQLWNAPVKPGGPHGKVTEESPVGERSINLQMITTSLTHGRPYRLPMLDETSRLFFDPVEMRDYFPKRVCEALVENSRPFVWTGDPAAHPVPGRDLRELPGADLPIVVAARLSLSYPFLLSTVRLWALDCEVPAGPQQPRPCHFTDGGTASNFPIHLFDSALPRWPTFGMWLDREKPYRYTSLGDGPVNGVWLPPDEEDGRNDDWNRFHPEAKPAGTPGKTNRAHLGLLAGFVGAIATGAFDWQDRTAMRLPHVRNRVARLYLRSGEGGLNIGMPREQILRMAHRYGTSAGVMFVDRFLDVNGQPSRAWRRQRWIRMELFLEGLRERLNGLSLGADWAAYTQPLDDALRTAGVDPHAAGSTARRALAADEEEALNGLLDELERLERVFRVADPPRSRQRPLPELRLRAPL